MPDDTRAQQALAILDQLERLPPNTSVTVLHAADGGWSSFRLQGVLNALATDHRGESATDALGQLTTVLALQEPSL